MPVFWKGHLNFKMAVDNRPEDLPKQKNAAGFPIDFVCLVTRRTAAYFC